MDKLFGYYIVFLLGAFPLLSFLSIPYITITYRAGTLLFGMLLLSYIVLSRGFYINKWVLGVCIFLFFYFLKLFYDFNYTNFDFGRDKLELSLFIFSSLFFPMLVLLFSKPSFFDIPTITFNLFIVLLLVCIFSLISGIVFGFKYRLSGNDILNPISLGNYAVTCLMLGSFLSMFYYSSYGRIKKALLKLSFPISILCLLLSASRGPMLSAFTLLVVFLLINKSGVVKNILYLLLFLMLLSLAFIISESFFDTMFGRMSVNLDENDGEARVFLWKLAIMKFAEAPIFGSHTTTAYGYVHNVLLEILMATGIVGASGIIYIFYHAWKNLVFYIKTNNEKCIFGFLFLQYLIAAFFSGTVYTSDLLWISLSIFIIISGEKLVNGNSNYINNH
jgi:hypothetical protein